MMEKTEIRSFFDRCAETWDAGMVRNERAIEAILDAAGICPGTEVLDVACGTGVLFPDYQRRGVASLTGIDLSPEMAARAREKYPWATVLCGDAEETDFSRQFDAVVIYNAFPHFPKPERLLERLCGVLRPGGRLTVAHGMSRLALLRHHSGAASRVSLELPEAETLAALLGRWLTVDTVVSDEEKYIVSGALEGR